MHIHLTTKRNNDEFSACSSHHVFTCIPTTKEEKNFINLMLICYDRSTNCKQMCKKYWNIRLVTVRVMVPSTSWGPIHDESQQFPITFQISALQIFLDFRHTLNTEDEGIFFLLYHEYWLPSFHRTSSSLSTYLKDNDKNLLIVDEYT